jgi:hypothetical protein
MEDKSEQRIALDAQMDEPAHNSNKSWGWPQVALFAIGVLLLGFVAVMATEPFGASSEKTIREMAAEGNTNAKTLVDLASAGDPYAKTLVDAGTLSAGLATVENRQDVSSASRGEAETQDRSVIGFSGAKANAVRSAKGYLAMTGFSRNGLIEQLSSDHGEGYDLADATTAVDSLDVDWNEQAARSAKQYLDINGFSCNRLIEQLSSGYGSKYTESQARYGAQQAGAC